MGQLQWIRRLRTNFHSEREVEIDIILAIAVHLGFGAEHRAVGYSVSNPRGQADVVLFAGEEHVSRAALVVWEAKKPENPQDPLPQARGYAEQLGAPLYATCNGESIALYRTTDHQLQFEVSSLGQLEDHWMEFDALLHRSVLLQRYPDRRLPGENEVRATFHERTYRERIQQRLGQVQVLFRHEGVDLRRVYVPTQLTPLPDRPSLQDERETSRSRRREDVGQVSEPQRIDEVVRQQPHLVVIGDLGAGKTTMLRHLTLELATGNLPGMEPIIPVYIPLNDLFRHRRQDDATSIEEYFFQYFQRDVAPFGIPRGDLWLRWWLERGRVALLWDGLDEVTGFAASQTGNQQAAEEAIALIRTLAESYGENLMVLTARRGAWQHRAGNLPPDFVVMEAQPFRPEDIQTFVRSWFEGAPEKAAILLAALDGNPQAYQLASNPLLLTFMVIRYEEYEELPGHDRYAIFSGVVELLLSKWDQDPSRRVNRRPVLNGPRMRWLLGEVALELHGSGNRFLRKPEIERLVTTFLERLPNLEPGQTEDVVEHDLETRYGLVRPFLPGEYGFLHLSLQEFFAAEAIDRYHWEEWWSTGRLLDHVGDPWWDEVFIHLAGGGHAETLIAALMDGQDDIFHTRLLLAGRALAGANAPVDRALQERVIEGLFGLLEAPYETGALSAAILADLGTAAVIERLLEIEASRPSPRAERSVLKALLRLRHPAAAGAALRLLRSPGGASSEIPDALARFAGPAEVNGLAEIGRTGERPRTGLFILSSITSPKAQPELMRLMRDTAERPSLRFAAALALLPSVPEAESVVHQLWQEPGVFSLLMPWRVPQTLGIRLLAELDPKEAPLRLLGWARYYCVDHGVRSVNPRLHGLVEKALELLVGRRSQRQLRAAWLLAALGDERVRLRAVQWLATKHRAKDGFGILAEYWPADLLSRAVPAEIVRGYLAGSDGIGQLVKRARPLVEGWWQQGILRDHSAEHFQSATTLMEAGMVEAVPDFCEQVRSRGKLERDLDPTAVETLLSIPEGRELLLDILGQRIDGPEWLIFRTIASLPDSDKGVLTAGLEYCLGHRADGRPRLDALQRVARGLDLFIYRGPDGELSYRPRRAPAG